MIYEFQGKHRFLSNFYTLPDGSTVEHRYQASKTTDEAERLEILAAKTPGDAKRLGSPANLKHLRPDWEQVKISVMTMLVREKFKWPELREKLLATNDEELQEGNYWKDVFWGIYPPGSNLGLNHLGKILMQVRKEIRDGSNETIGSTASSKESNS